MIRLFRHLYINPLTIAVIVFCYINRRLEIFCISYAVMLLHETGHLCAALLLGLRVSYIALQPFGVNLKLMNKIIGGAADEIILYLCGPAVNIVLVLISSAVYIYCPNAYIEYFQRLNLLLALINLMPVLPLDGGVILRTLLASRLGYKNAVKAVKALSIIIGAGLFIIGAAVNAKSEWNLSIMFISIFVLGSVITQREKYNHDYIKELMHYNDKPKRNAVIKVCRDGDSAYSLAEGFTSDKYTITAVLDSDGKIKNFVTETQILNSLTNDKSTRRHNLASNKKTDTDSVRLRKFLGIS